MKTARHSVEVREGQVWLCGDQMFLKVVHIVGVYKARPGLDRPDLVSGYIPDAHKMVEMEPDDFIQLLDDRRVSNIDCRRIWNTHEKGYLKGVEYTSNVQEAMLISLDMFDRGELVFEYLPYHIPRWERLKRWFRRLLFTVKNRRKPKEF